MAPWESLFSLLPAPVLQLEALVGLEEPSLTKFMCSTLCETRQQEKILAERLCRTFLSILFQHLASCGHYPQTLFFFRQFRDEFA